MAAKLNISLSEWVDQKQSTGRYYFTRDQAATELELCVGSFKKAAGRLSAKKRIVRVHSGFYVIVPLEYTSAGIIPADWFIADFMAHLKQPFYVGLLTAAAYYGASHQRSQKYHVVTNKPIREIRCRTVVISFFKKNDLASAAIEQIKTTTGYVPVSSPETTALDLLRYVRRVGGISSILTVFQELGEKLDSAKLVAAAKNEGDLAYIQRLGWLLDQTAFGNKTGPLADWIKQQNPPPIKLYPSLPKKGFERNRRWNLWINTDVQGDLT